MKIKFFFFALLLNFVCHSQLRNGFDQNEAKDMAALICSYTFLDLYKSDAEIIPDAYKKTYTSEVNTLDNVFQVYKKGSVGVINLRGSTAKKSSWLENFYSSMIPASGELMIGDEKHVYSFSTNDESHVHSGYALAICYLADDILKQIKALNTKGVYNILITGHSQGGALAQMLMAYLNQLPNEKLSSKNKFKTYAFASPMCGNLVFANDYEQNFGNGYSFNVINPADVVPTFPLSYNDSTLFTMADLKTFLFDREHFDYKGKVTDGVIQLFEKTINNTITFVGNSVNKQISKEGDTISMPEAVKDINYIRLAEVIETKPAHYPDRLRDSTILENDSLMAIYKRGEDGRFENEALYEKQPVFYQHKPYNYYVTILEIYFPDQYAVLEKKYLIENTRD